MPEVPDFGQARLLSRPRNYAVVQLPEREFPGVVFQGDSLHCLIADLERASLTAATGKTQELETIIGQLREVMTGYEQVCLEQKLPLPYMR